METAAVSAVISTTLKAVANKLAPLLIKEYSYIVGVKRDIEELRDQVEEINSWLETRYEAVWHDTSFKWLKRLKEIAYAVDDVVNEFQLKAEKHDAAADVSTMSKYMCRKPKSFVSQCKAANKIKKIKKIFAAIVKQRTDYNAIANSISVNPPVRQTKSRTVEMSSWPDIDETSVIGRGEDKKHIISKLEETDDQPKLKIISIIGLGGSGKTTLAKLIFNDGNIKKIFDFTLWVHVSKEFDADKLVKKLFEAFADNNPGQHGVPYMRKTILEKLIGKRFLLVLDDVWTESRFQWESLWEFLINTGAPGSRILLTTRSSKIAEMLGSTPFELPLLSEASSWQLFTESYGMAENSLDPEFLKVGKEIVEKCGGVPLAIKVLAGVLRDKEHIEEWEAMRNNSLLDVEGEEHRVFSCLRLSYLHLPSHLKQCFTICSVFPKGHQIDKEQLIDQWIAHDLITLEDGVDHLEYVGYKHFNSLVQMSFLNLEDLEEKGGRVTCKMHDLVHDLARCILGDDFFFLGESDESSIDLPMEATKSTNNYRYFSLIVQPRILLPKNLFVKARAVYVAADGDSIFGKELKNARHLRSIIVEDTESIHTTILQLKYLRYLNISHSWELEALPEVISDVWSLQALHITNCYSFLKLPKSIGKLQKLRTLNLSGCGSLKSLPDSIGDCHMISSIDLCDCSKLTMLPNSIGKLQKLRTLNLSRCNSLKCLPDSIGGWHMISSIDLSKCHMLTVLPNSIGQLRKLRLLRLSQCGELKCLPDSIGDCQMISSIDLCYCMELTMLYTFEIFTRSGCIRLKFLPDSIGHCQMISSIDLSNCCMLNVLPSSITELRNLECLDLCFCQELVELPEGIGNLDKLHVLNIYNCKKLGSMPVGIGQLSRIQKLDLFVVGESEKFAKISELANIGRNNEYLTIRGIAHVMDPDDAHRACLKQKTNLQRLSLQWMAHDIGEVNTELMPAVLDGLEPPAGIRELEICGYSGRRYAQWMHNQVGGRVQELSHFPFLRVMELRDFPNLKHLHGLAGLPFLEELGMWDMPSLESISGGPFPSLVKLVMSSLPSLGAVWMVAEKTMADGEERGQCSSSTTHMGQVRVDSCVSELSIICCPKLKVMPHVPLSLQHLMLSQSSEQLLQSPGQYQGSYWSASFSHLKKLELDGMTGSGRGWELLQHMMALQSFHIQLSDMLTELPESLGSLTSLQSLVVTHCSGICVLPESLGELRSLQELAIENCYNLSCLPQSVGQLTSLQVLKISFCHAFHQLPECLGKLYSLRTLKIIRLPRLTCLPQSMCGLTCLECLVITNCPGIKSLQEDIIKGLTSLQRLEIDGCPDLTKRYNRKNGEDWHLVSGIPHTSIY